ncbi:uncharacterized protein [Diabrotica undecimpunctata]|uniref:uncharacterized protein n=1 Tax=Diabrotica undecimpunctata TaxID=50387 RepID=UPI003B6338D0
MRVATWNIKSLNNRDQEIEKELTEYQIDIFALQETKRKGKGQTRLGEYLLIYSGVPKQERAKEGVAIMIKTKYKDQIKECQYISQRILLVKIRANGKIINTIGICAPDDCKPDSDKEEFYDELNELRINYTFFDHKIQHKYTFENTRGHRSMIDYVVTNRNIHHSEYGEYESNR